MILVLYSCYYLKLVFSHNTIIIIIIISLTIPQKYHRDRAHYENNNPEFSWKTEKNINS